jgi:hypothetical protein
MCETPPGPVVEEVCTAEITHLWRAGGRLIPLAHRRRRICQGARDYLYRRPRESGVQGERLDF